MPKLRKKEGQSSSGHRPSWHVGNKLQSIDLFGREVPAFNLKGETHVNTTVGGLVSVLILITTLLYTVIKFQ